MELLQLTRAGDCEQSGNGALALGTPIAEHDLPPLHGRPEGSFGHVVGGCDRLFMHEGHAAPPAEGLNATTPTNAAVSPYWTVAWAAPTCRRWSPS